MRNNSMVKLNIVLSVFLVIPIFALSKSGKSEVIGTWKWQGKSTIITYVFTKDTFTATREKDLGEFGKQIQTIKGSYIISNDKLILTSDDGQKKVYPFSIDKNSLNLNGVIYTKIASPEQDYFHQPLPKQKSTSDQKPISKQKSPSKQTADNTLVAPDGIISVRYPKEWQANSKQEIDIVMGTGMYHRQNFTSKTGEKLIFRVSTEIVSQDELVDTCMELLETSGGNPYREEQITISGFEVNSAYCELEDGRCRLIAFTSDGLGIASRIAIIADTQEIFEKYSSIIDSILNSVEISLAPNKKIDKMLIGTWKGEWVSHISTPDVGWVGGSGDVIYVFSPKHQYTLRSWSEVGVGDRGGMIESGASEIFDQGIYRLIGNKLVLMSQKGEVNAIQIFTFEDTGDKDSFMMGKKTLVKRVR